MSKAVTGNNVVSWKLWGRITLPARREKKHFSWPNGFKFCFQKVIQNRMQGNITSSSLTSRVGREGGQPHDLHFWLLTLQGPRWLTGLCVIASYRSSTITPLEAAGDHTSVKVPAPTVARTNPFSIQVPHSPTESRECARSAKGKVALLQRGLFLMIRLDISLHVSSFSYFLEFLLDRSRPIIGSPYYDFLAPVSTDADLRPGLCIVYRRHRLPPALKWLWWGYALPAYA